MGLVERLSTELVATPPKCSLGRLLDSLTEVEAVAVQDAIDKIRAVDGRSRKSQRYPYTSVWLSEQLAAEGYHIHRKTVDRHVARGCTCGS